MLQFQKRRKYWAEFENSQKIAARARKCLTLLLDGWEDRLRRSLYGSVAVEVGHDPIVLALEDMTGVRGTAENLVTVSQKALKRMEIGSGKNLIAVTTDNPTVMQAFRRKFKEAYPWVLVSYFFYDLQYQTKSNVYRCSINDHQSSLSVIVITRDQQ